MSNEYIPEVGTKTVPVEPKTKTVTGVLNPPAAGTRLRVTLPGTETVLVGAVTGFESEYALIDLEIEGCEGFYLNNITLWIASGWKFEVLPPLPVAVDAERELVDAL